MNISCRELKTWIEEGRDLDIIDVRTKSQKNQFPLIHLSARSVDESDLNIKDLENRKTLLICQFGIHTQHLIENHDLENVYNLIGGAQAWNELMSTQRDLGRYSRQMALSEIGKNGQYKLLRSKVVVVGMGGLGCPVAQYLTAAGVGFLRLIDGDMVDVTNLQRQPLFANKDVGSPKVDVAKRVLSELNPETKIEAKNIFLNEANVNELLENADIIVDATDNMQTRIVMDAYSNQNGIPLVYGGLYRFEGQVSVFNFNGGKSYTDLFPLGSTGAPTCSDEGVVGMLPGIIGSIQALETVKILLGIEPNLSGKLLLYDGITHTMQQVDLING
ncbi:MAG: ThiF family adenylyltransferase [Candidatus Marinimicrobia bacterium]|nr:ThiF family adenylyltransferase [Candidatus Neomarinimicrobiota bacterium]